MSEPDPQDDVVDAFTDAIDKLTPRRRDPVAEQDEAARRFKERTGRDSTDPAPPGVMRFGIGPDGRVRAETLGYTRDPNDDFDPFKSAGIERVHHQPAAIEAPVDEVRLTTSAATPIREALVELFNEPDAQRMITESAALAAKRADAIEANVVDTKVDPEAFWYHCTIDPNENTMTLDLEPCRDPRCLHAHVGLVLRETQP